MATNVAVSKGPESSALSKSISQTTAAYRQDIISAKTTFLDRTFPLFDEILKHSKIPNFLYYLLTLYCVIQFFCVSLWPGFIATRHYDEVYGEIVKVVLHIGFMSDFAKTDSSYLASFLVCIILSVFLIILLIIEFVIYSKTRRFIIWTLYIARFAVEFIPMIVVIPMGNFLGCLFVELTSNPSTTEIVFFVLTILFWILMLLCLFLNSMFASSTTFIPPTPMACWNGSISFGLTASLALFTFISYVFEIFDDWIEILLTILKIAYSVYLIYETTMMPFIRVTTNVLVAGSITATVLLDILAIVQLCGPVIPYYAHIIVAIVGLIVASIAWHFIQKKMYNDVMKKLSSKRLEEQEDEENLEPMEEQKGASAGPAQVIYLQDHKRKNLMIKYGLDKSMKKCEYYIRVGIAQRCDLFLDWTLLKFMAEYHDNAHSYCFITLILSFFPAESRLLKAFFSLTVSKTGLSIRNRFMLYEVHRVIGLRQSSASAEITDKLIEIKHLSLKGMKAVRGFWKEIPESPHFFLQVKQFTDQANSLFRESMDKWPNNARICEDYSKFLIECAMDYTEGVKMKHRAELIEQGKNFVADLCFRSMVRIYPLYLKRAVLDIKGNYITKKNASSTVSSNINSQISTGTIDGELDVEIEENLSKSLFSFHRLRLAFQRALIGRSCIYSTLLKAQEIFSIILFIGFNLFFFIYFYSLYNSRQDNMNRLLVTARMRQGLDSSLLSMLIYWAHEAGSFSDELYMDMIQPSPGSNEFNLNLQDGNTIREVAKWISYGRESLEDFLDQMMVLSSQNDDIRSYMAPMFQKTTNFHFCIDDNGLSQPELISLKSSYGYIFLRIRELIISPNNASPIVTTWNESESLCEVFYNVPNINESFDTLTYDIVNEQMNRRDDTEHENYLILIIICVIYTVLTIPLLIVFTFKLKSELGGMLTMMRGIDDDTKNEATKLLKEIPGQEENDPSNEQLTNGKVRPSELVVLFVITLLIGNALFIGDVMLAQSSNNDFLNLNEWLYQGSRRGPLILEILFYSIFVIAISHGHLSTNMIDLQTAINYANSAISELKMANDATLRGTDEYPGCANYSQELDALHYEENCLPCTGISSFHQTYECSNLDDAISTFSIMAEAIFRAPEEYDFEHESQFYHLFHLANVHMLDSIHQAAMLLNDNSISLLSSFRMNLLIITICGIVYAIACIFIFWALVIKMDKAFEGSLQLLRRIPPLACTSNPSVMNYLLHKKSEKTDDKMTASKAVIMGSRDAIICLHRNESIEVVNQTVSSIFGYTPEQLLGHPISSILPQEEAEQVFHHFNLMRAGQCSLTFECSTIGKTDDDQSVPIHVTVLGICDDNSRCANSFVVIARDETTLQKHRKEAEDAKAQSEHLLYQILPRDIVVRLNQGETDISFSVPSATIIFVDIVKWSDYSSTLTPAQIMCNLSLIFAKFDACCAKYNLIQKIKLIGDVYMAAAGLFTPNEPPKNHAQQVIQFGLDCLVALDEANGQLDASLQVRIGVNTDGPLIAGVLGTDKPVFDIIGDPINVSSRLQSTCIPNTIQISQTTYDAVAELNFNIEQRGEVMLKGKGKKMAYIVRPSMGESFYLNEKDGLSGFDTL